MELLMHQCPEGFEYTMDDFNKTTKRIWITNHTQEFQYREGAGPPKSIWGFYKPKSKKYYAPINHKKIGKEVRLEDTRPYSAMPLNLNPLMSAFA